MTNLVRYTTVTVDGGKLASPQSVVLNPGQAALVFDSPQHPPELEVLAACLHAIELLEEPRMRAVTAEYLYDRYVRHPENGE